MDRVNKLKCQKLKKSNQLKSQSRHENPVGKFHPYLKAHAGDEVGWVDADGRETDDAGSAGSEDPGVGGVGEGLEGGLGAGPEGVDNLPGSVGGVQFVVVAGEGTCEESGHEELGSLQFAGSFEG